MGFRFQWGYHQSYGDIIGKMGLDGDIHGIIKPFPQLTLNTPQTKSWKKYRE
jgi:hypothetical protein